MGSESCAFVDLPTSASLQAPPAGGQSPASGNASPPSPAKPAAPTRRVRSRPHPVHGTAPQVCVVCARRSGALLRHPLSRPFPVTPTPVHLKPAPDSSRCSQLQLSHEGQLLYTLAGAGPETVRPRSGRSSVPGPLARPRLHLPVPLRCASGVRLCPLHLPELRAGASGVTVPRGQGASPAHKGGPTHVVRGKLLACWGPPRLRPPQQEAEQWEDRSAPRTTPAGSRPARKGVHPGTAQPLGFQKRLSTVSSQMTRLYFQG